MDAMSDMGNQRNPIERLAEEFLTRYRGGERPALSEYTNQNPELADEIRDLFPVLVLMEKAGPSGHDRIAEPQESAERRMPERLGEYRLLREIGRGGMGVVYEAEQESLGRHVALKVLPNSALSDPHRLARFRQEARAAARLHHTNIVPIFGVGEASGCHFFAMQYIPGQALDQVLDELRKLRALPGATVEFRGGSPSTENEPCPPPRPLTFS
jgi:serine/threonine protein kinase